MIRNLLFRQVAEGDEIAFRKIFDLYKTKLAVFIFRMIKSESCTEELVQDIFRKALDQQIQISQC